MQSGLQGKLTTVTLKITFHQSAHMIISILGTPKTKKIVSFKGASNLKRNITQLSKLIVIKFEQHLALVRAGKGVGLKTIAFSEAFVSHKGHLTVFFPRSMNKTIM